MSPVMLPLMMSPRENGNENRHMQALFHNGVFQKDSIVMHHLVHVLFHNKSLVMPGNCNRKLVVIGKFDKIRILMI